MDSKGNKRRFWWFWAFWIAAFVIVEGYALATKEKLVPTFSRTFWAFIDWIVAQVGEHRRRTVTIIVIGVLLIAGIWAALHLGGGPCAFGLCR